MGVGDTGSSQERQDTVCLSLYVSSGMQGRGGKLTDNMLINECGYERVDEVEVSDRLELYIPSLDKGATPGRELEKDR
jgi:hypothetical protein